MSFLRTLPILVKGMKTLDVPIIVNEQYKKELGNNRAFKRACN